MMTPPTAPAAPTEATASAQAATTPAATELTPHYVIELAGDLYAIPQSGEIALSWVQRPQDPTYLPTLPSWCLGLVNERNTPVLLVDLRAVLGLSPADDGATRESAESVRHVFVTCNGDTIGLLVDRTHRFRLLQRTPPTTDGEFIAGAARSGEHTVRTLNIEAIWRFILRALGAPDTDAAA